jgi:DNA-binding beta-propeller fold protein YncE
MACNIKVSGRILSLLLCGVSAFNNGGAAVSANPYPVGYEYVAEWGVLGTAAGEFNKPSGLGIAADGGVYVVDYCNNRIQYFTANGSFRGAWGSRSEGAVEFGCVTGLAVARGGPVYVVDSGNEYVQLFDLTGAFMGRWPVASQADYILEGISDVSVSDNGDVYITETGSGRNDILRFTADGIFVDEWHLESWGRPGFNFFISDIAVGPDGSVYVVLADEVKKVRRYSPEGDLINEWGSAGTGLGEFIDPGDISVAPDGTVFVTDPYSPRIQYFTAEGSFIGTFGSAGSGAGEFNFPCGISVGPDGTVYVADTGNHRIQYFKPVISEGP